MALTIFKDFFSEPNDVNKQEIKKFLVLGIVYAFITGIVGLLQPFKTALFFDIVGAAYIPKVQEVTLIAFLPLMILYSVIAGRVAHHILFYVISFAFALATLEIGWLMLDPQIGLQNHIADHSRLLGWAWYIFADNYGIFLVPLFWAFAAHVTSPASARLGFSIIILFGILGTMFFPYALIQIPFRFHINNAYIVIMAAALMIIVPLLISLLMYLIPKEHMVGFVEREPGEQSLWSFAGLRSLLTSPYLLALLGMTIFGYLFFNASHSHLMRTMASQITNKFERLNYLGSYAFYSGVAGFICLLFGWLLSLRIALLLLPLCAILAFGIVAFYPSLATAFWLMAAVKAIHTTIYFPAQKQLYIPTSDDVRFKSQIWIDRFGPFIAGITSAAVNFTALSPLAIGSIAFWIFIVLYLSKRYDTAISQKQNIC